MQQLRAAMQQLRAASLQLAGQLERRANTTIAGAVYYRCAYHSTEPTALISPAEKIRWDYGELWRQVTTLAGGLTKAGYGPGCVVATDLDHNAQNLLLQMAVAHNQMQVLTVKSEDEYRRLSSSIPVKGAVPAPGSSFLQGATVAELQESGGKAGAGGTDRKAALAFYSSDAPTGNRQVYLHGVSIAGLLAIAPTDQVCVAASLNHAFGIGGAISAVVRSATIYLPDPASPDVGGSTLLIGDEQGLAALGTRSSSTLRDGLVKVGDYSGETGIPYVNGFTEIAGVSVHELRPHGDPVFCRPLFDACADTYYPVRESLRK